MHLDLRGFTLKVAKSCTMEFSVSHARVESTTHHFYSALLICTRLALSYHVVAFAKLLPVIVKYFRKLFPMM